MAHTVVSEKHPTYYRHSTLELGMVLPLIRDIRRKEKNQPKDKGKEILMGISVGVSSLRMRTFAAKGCDCVTCGATGAFFAIEKPFNLEDNHYHLNLYAYRKDDSEVLMTHDHIIARSLGGADVLDNAQPMCTICNNEKSKEEVKEVARRHKLKGE